LIQDSLIPANQISTDDFAGQSTTVGLIELALTVSLCRLAGESDQPGCVTSTHGDVRSNDVILLTAIKGIIGIGAMAAIESLLGNTAKASNYSVRVAEHETRRGH
jgi:hypothetical protein